MIQNSIVILSIVIFCLAMYNLSKRSYYNSKHPMLDKVRHNFGILNPDYAKIPLKLGDSAYTENKEVITLCIVDPETGQYYDINTIMYVAIHELAHVVSKNQGHGDEFKQNFAKLLKEASEKRIYDPRRPIPATYCKIST